MDISALNLNYFDIAIATIVIILGIKGMVNGFIRELFGMVGLVGGIYLGSRLNETVGHFIDQNIYHVENLAALKLIGFVGVLAGVWIVAVTLGAIFSSLTHASGLGFINRLLGFVVGGGKYFLIFALIFTALSNITLVKENLGKYITDSQLYPYLLSAGSYLINIDPKALHFEEGNATLALPTPAILIKEANLTQSADQNSSKEQ